MSNIGVVLLGDKGGHIKELQSALVDLGYKPGPVDGWFGNATRKAVVAFQEDKGLIADGIVGQRTMEAIITGIKPSWSLTDEDLKRAADNLGVDLATVMAISEVESAGAGFIKGGHPKILFERHWMYKRLKHHNYDPKYYSVGNEDIINSTPGGYSGGIKEYLRINRAKTIHEISAIESTSWGRFQIMGFHWKRLGYLNALDFELEMCTDEGKHLDAFVEFIRTDGDLHRALKCQDWKEVARIYNGPNYHINKYDDKMASAYKRFRDQDGSLPV